MEGLPRNPDEHRRTKRCSSGKSQDPLLVIGLTVAQFSKGPGPIRDWEPDQDPVESPKRFPATVDVVLAAICVILSEFAFRILPEGSLVRLALVVPVLFFAPGYLLLQACLVPARPVANRVIHAVFSTILSPSLIAVLALMAALVPGAFKPGIIVFIVTVASLLCATIALLRRYHHAQRAVREFESFTPTRHHTSTQASSPVVAPSISPPRRSP